MNGCRSERCVAAAQLCDGPGRAEPEASVGTAAAHRAPTPSFGHRAAPPVYRHVIADLTGLRAPDVISYFLFSLTLGILALRRPACCSS